MKSKEWKVVTDMFYTLRNLGLCTDEHWFDIAVDRGIGFNDAYHRLL